MLMGGRITGAASAEASVAAGSTTVDIASCDLMLVAATFLDWWCTGEKAAAVAKVAARAAKESFIFDVEGSEGTFEKL